MGFYGLTKTDLYLETVRGESVEAFYRCVAMWVGLTWKIKTLMTRKTETKLKMREDE
jgi:hypothetical protein